MFHVSFQAQISEIFQCASGHKSSYYNVMFYSCVPDVGLPFLNNSDLVYFCLLNEINGTFMKKEWLFY